MKAYWIKSPRWLSFIFRKRIWHFSPEEKTIYLTFDDGPTTVTSFVLDQLEQYNAKATFFCIGDNIDKNPTILKKLKEQGHCIGNHTQHHSNGWKINTRNYLKEISEVDSKIYDKSQKPVIKLFRPPFGKSTYSQRQLIYKKGYKIIMWSVLSADFDHNVTKEQCLQNVISNTSNGNIIIFHDSKKAEEKLRYVLPKVLEYFSEKGYQFKGIDSSTQ